MVCIMETKTKNKNKKGGNDNLYGFIGRGEKHFIWKLWNIAWLVKTREGGFILFVKIIIKHVMIIN